MTISNYKGYTIAILMAFIIGLVGVIKIMVSTAPKEPEAIVSGNAPVQKEVTSGNSSGTVKRSTHRRWIIWRKEK